MRSQAPGGAEDNEGQFSQSNHHGFRVLQVASTKGCPHMAKQCTVAQV